MVVLMTIFLIGSLTVDTLKTDCKEFIKLMEIKWKDRVTKMAKTVVQIRLYYKDIPSPDIPSADDIKKLSEHVVLTVSDWDTVLS